MLFCITTKSDGRNLNAEIGRQDFNYVETQRTEIGMRTSDSVMCISTFRRATSQNISAFKNILEHLQFVEPCDRVKVSGNVCMLFLYMLEVSDTKRVRSTTDTMRMWQAEI